MEKEWLVDAQDKSKIPLYAIKNYFENLKDKNVNIHSMILLKGNHIWSEHYFNPTTKESIMPVYSISKSITSIAIGCLIRDGKLKLTDKICKFFKDKLPENGPHPWIEEMTIRHLLTMATAHASTTFYRHDKDDWVESFFQVTPDYAPGTRFSYDTSASHVLAALVERLSNQSILDYVKEQLLSKIGADQGCEWLKDSCGVSQGGSGFSCTTRDLAKIAYVCNHHGNFFGKQLLDETYMKEATSKQIDTSMKKAVEEQQGYGYQFWQVRHGGFALYGIGGQLAVCFPKYDFIYITTADAQGSLPQTTQLYEAFWTYLFPYVEGE